MNPHSFSVDNTFMPSCLSDVDYLELIVFLLNKDRIDYYFFQYSLVKELDDNCYFINF